MGSVSAIVSAYFAEQFIERRLCNLQKQRPDVEIVVVAQIGSKEERIAETHGVKTVHTEGIPTIYAAWNMGVRNASGEYITNANSDDLHYPGALKTLSETLDEKPQFALCYADCDITTKYGGYPTNRYCWSEGDFADLLQACFIGPMPMWRASLHKKYGYFDEEMHCAGDYEFWLRIMKNGERAIHLPRALGLYLARKDSAGHKESLRVTWETSRARSRYSNSL